MKPTKRSPITAWLTCLSLTVSLCAGIMVGDHARAATPKAGSQPSDKSGRSAKASYPTLSLYAIDLTQRARRGQLEPVKGHGAAIRHTIQILSSDTDNNPVLVGESGASTAVIAEGLALRIASGKVPGNLLNKRLFSLNLDTLAKDTKSSDEVAARLLAALAEVENSNGRVILFVDQLHQFVGTYAPQASSDTLRRALQHSQVRIVGGTSLEAYTEYIAGDAVLSDLFKQVRVGVEDATELSENEETNETEHKANRNAEGFQGDKISADLREMMQSARSGNDRVKLILQVDDVKSGKLNALMNSNGVRVDARFPRLGAMQVEVPVKVVEQLAASGSTRYMSLDRQVQSMGHLSRTTGADAVRVQTTTNLLGQTTTTALDGSGIGIAVMDSGLDLNHKAFLGNNGASRIVFSKDFTGENRVDDPYGHGTHVAAIAAGNGRIANANYIGIAPNANIINLRVLNSLGTGTIAKTLSALDWVLANHATYNIRVVNMSLGTPAVDSYKNDPICRAVRRLVDAGIVVAAAAGNNGRNSAGQKVYGQIHSPGNEPSAITVGASNTYGTESRQNDGVATYSSRGPTRSSWTDASGVKHYDNLIKPELVAPGNKIINAEADRNFLVTTYPQLDSRVSDSENRGMMYMSGSSMATPATAGAAALMLQANSTLTPNMVKALLMYSAQPLAGSNSFEQGAGQLNIEGAVRLAKMVRKDFGNSKPIGAALMSSLLPPVPQTTIAGHTFTWSQGLVMGQQFAKGAGLITKYQPIFALGIVISDGVVVNDGGISIDGVVVSDGVVIIDGVVISDGVIIDGVVVSDSVVVSDGFILGSGSLFISMENLLGVGVSDGYQLGDGVVVSDGVVVGDGVIISDSVVVAQSAEVNGDLTDTAVVVVDTGVDCLDYLGDGVVVSD